MTPTPLRRLFTFALLGAQLIAAGAASMAHARERLDAPRHIESSSSDQCLVVHDATSCVLCAWSHARADAPPPRAVTPMLPEVASAYPPALVDPPGGPAVPSGGARAPPLPPG